jgi:hypothetical protein
VSQQGAVRQRLEVGCALENHEVDREARDASQRRGDDDSICDVDYPWTTRARDRRGVNAVPLGCQAAARQPARCSWSTCAVCHAIPRGHRCAFEGIAYDAFKTHRHTRPTSTYVLLAYYIPIYNITPLAS